MEKMPQENRTFLNEAEKNAIIETSIENTDNLEDVVASVNSQTEESFHAKNEQITQDRIQELQKDLTEERTAEYEERKKIELSDEDRKEIMHGVEEFDKANNKYHYDPLTMIRAGDGLNGREYFHTDEKGSKARLFFGNRRGDTLEALGNLAEQLGIDLTEGKTINEIRVAIDERLA